MTHVFVVARWMDGGGERVHARPNAWAFAGNCEKKATKNTSCCFGGDCRSYHHPHTILFTARGIMSAHSAYYKSMYIGSHRLSVW